MPLRFVVVAAALLVSIRCSFANEKSGKANHVVVVVWDGMRPDFVTEQNTPTLAALAREGVVFKNNHSVYPSSTNVNGVVLATGCEPARNGVIANQEYRAEIDPHKPFDTSDFSALNRIDNFTSKFIATPTVAEIVQEAGFRTAIAGSKPVVRLISRAGVHPTEAARHSVVVYRGKVLPAKAEAALTTSIGSFPVRKGLPNDKEDTWTTRALTEFLWKEDVPRFSVLWLSEPDLSEHETAPGSPMCMAAIKSSDENLAKVLAALKAKNALTNTDLIVVSDHGFSTVDLAIDAAALLRAAGFDAVRELGDKPPTGQVLVVTLGGSIGFYVIDHDQKVVARLVEFLQRSDFAETIFTRKAQAGTFALERAQLETPNAPDVLVACRWNNQRNEFGVAGQIASDIGRKVGGGTTAP